MGLLTLALVLPQARQAHGGAEFRGFGTLIDAIYSSPYRRAVDTIAVCARQIGRMIESVGGLRERLLAPGLLPNWRGLQALRSVIFICRSRAAS